MISIFCIVLPLLLVPCFDSRPVSKEDGLATSPFDTFIDGDMKIDHLLENGDHNIGSRKRRAAYQHPQLTWPDAIVPYYFDPVSNVSERQRNITMEAFDHIMEHSCIKFVPKRDGDISFMNITGYDPEHCFAYVGRSARGPSPLNLGLKCDELGVIIHEILHVLGFLHEHTRPDRDDHVTVNHTNIRPDAVIQFKKLNLSDIGNITMYGITYDKQSIMHYDSYTFTKFAKDGKIPAAKQEYMVMYSKTDPFEKLGNNKLSIKDILRLNKHFDCKTNLTMILATAKTTTTTTTTTTPTTTTPPPPPTTTSTATDSNKNSNKTTTTTTEPRRTIIIDGKVYNVTKFGTPDSASTNYMSFLNIMVISVVSLYFCVL